MNVSVKTQPNDNSESVYDFNKKSSYFNKEAGLVLKLLTNRFNEISLLKANNLVSIKNSKKKDEIYYLFCVREIYDTLLYDLEKGIESVSSLSEFIKIIDSKREKYAKLKAESSGLRKHIDENRRMFMHNSQRVIKLSILNVYCEEYTENIIFSLLLLDEFHLDRETYENNLWNMAIGDNSETVFIHLSQELLEVKWMCTQTKDDVEVISEQLSQYCERNIHNEKLLIDLCYIAYKFYECFNYKCSGHVLDLAMTILKAQRTSSKEKYYHFYLCKGLLLIKFKDYDGGIKILMECVKYLKNKLETSMEKDFFISMEFMNIGSIMANNDFNSLSTTVLEISLECLEQYLPLSYDLWIETVDLLARAYNDIFDFTISLMTVAPTFDYFHILNFGSISVDNKPVYEIAIEIGNSGFWQKLSRQLKYPTYLPINISHLINEMMVSFSGLGDQTGVSVIKNWKDRCENQSRGYRRLIIESCVYFGTLDMDRVVRKMRKNRKRHNALFKNLIINDIEESQISTMLP